MIFVQLSARGSDFSLGSRSWKSQAIWHNFIKTSKYSSLLSNYRTIPSQSAVPESLPKALQEIDEGTTGQPAYCMAKTGIFILEMIGTTAFLNWSWKECIIKREDPWNIMATLLALLQQHSNGNLTFAWANRLKEELRAVFSLFSSVTPGSLAFLSLTAQKQSYGN